MNDLSTVQLRRLLAIAQQEEKLKKEKQRIMGEVGSAPKRTLSAKTRKMLSKKLKAVWAARKARG